MMEALRGGEGLSIHPGPGEPVHQGPRPPEVQSHPGKQRGKVIIQVFFILLTPSQNIPIKEDIKTL